MKPVAAPHRADDAIAPFSVHAWAPRPAIAPQTTGSLDATLVMASNGSPGCYGGWELVYPAGARDAHVHFEVGVRWHDVHDGFEAVSAEACWQDERGNRIDWAPIRSWRPTEDGLTLYGTLANLAGADRLAIRLLLRWTPTGRVEWRAPRLVPAHPPAPRPLRIGAASSLVPPGAKDLADNRQRFVDLCRHAGEHGVQLLCLPETILSWRLPGQRPETLTSFAIEVPGPEIEPFCDVARQYRMAIGFSVLEREAERVYNTAVLIDAQGNVADKYRKVHLAVPEETWSGITPGDRFSVADLAFAPRPSQSPSAHPAAPPTHARVGMNICMDSSALEASRAVARLGAEILLLPIMGDHRADRWTRGRPRFDFQRWLMIQQMRAMDNHLYLVAARNEGVGSGIFAPDGSVLALDGGDRPLVWADIDLSERKHSWTGATFQDICWFERREPVYDVLSGRLQPQL